MSIIIFLFMNLTVLISSYLVTYKLFQLSNFIDSLICWFLLYFTQIVFTEIILGILGILYLKNVILINLLILLIIWLIVKNRTSSFSLLNIKVLILELLKNKVILFGTSVILGFTLVKICINLINPPFGWDCLNYHFTFPVKWLKHGNLDIPITVLDDPSPTYYPINGNLYFLWLMFPLKNTFIADLGQIPFFLLAFLSVVSISRKLKLDKNLSFSIAIVFFLIPNFFKQLEIAYVDVMVAALFLASLDYLFLLQKEYSIKFILIYSVALGLFLGTKTIALPYTILLLIPFIYLYLRNLNKAKTLIILTILIIIILGGFTYIRNFIDTGNPLYPLDLKLFGKTLLKGVIDTHSYRAHFKIEDYKLSKLLFHEGLGIQSIIFILPSIFLALPIILIKKRKTLNFNLVYFSILPILIYLIYRYIIPLANTRYLYPLLGIGIIIGFYILNILSIPKLIIKILVTICILASMFELASHIELITSIILTFLLFFLAPILIKNIPKIRLINKFFILVLTIFLLVILIFVEKDYIKNEFPRYIGMEKYSGFWPDATRAWNWLNKNTTGNNIAYVGRPVPFPLYGTNFKNNVYYVSVNKTEPAKLHYFANSYYKWYYNFEIQHKDLERKGNYRTDADYSVWLNNILKRNTDYLFIYSLHQTKEVKFPMEDDWAKANPNKFIPVFTNGTIHIYRILK